MSKSFDNKLDIVLKTVCEKVKRCPDCFNIGVTDNCPKCGWNEKGPTDPRIARSRPADYVSAKKRCPDCHNASGVTDNCPECGWDEKGPIDPRIARSRPADYVSGE